MHLIKLRNGWLKTIQMTLLWESTEVVVSVSISKSQIGYPYEVLDVRLRDPKRNDLRNPEKAYAFKKKILIIDDINDTGETFLDQKTILVEKIELKLFVHTHVTPTSLTNLIIGVTL